MDCQPPKFDRNSAQMQVRVNLAHIAFDILGAAHKTWVPEQHQLSSDVQTILLGFAVVIAWGSGKTLGVTKLAAAIGTSPQTAARKLSYLESAGVLRKNGRKYEVNMDRINTIPDIEERLLRVAREVIKCAELIKEQLEKAGKL